MMLYALIFALHLGDPPAPGIVAGYYKTLPACLEAGSRASLVVIDKDGNPIPVDKLPVAFLCHQERVS